MNQHWTMAWCYASHADDFDDDSGIECGIDYTVGVIDFDYTASDDAFEEATVVQSLFEASFWMGRANKSDEFTGSIGMAAYNSTPHTLVTEATALDAIKNGWKFGRDTKHLTLDEVWTEWSKTTWGRS